MGDTLPASVSLPSGLTSIGANVFRNSGLTSVIVPDSVTSIGINAFLDAASLTSVILGSHVTWIGDEAFESTGITSIVIPASVISLGIYAFQNTPLASVTLNSGLQSIGGDAFDSTRLTAINIPGSVTSIGEWAFWNTPLTSATLHSGLLSIGEAAFNETLLTSIVIPSTVTSSGNALFGDDDGARATYPMTDITFLGNAPSVPLTGRTVDTELFFASPAVAQPVISPGTAIHIASGLTGWPAPPLPYYGIQTTFSAAGGGTFGGGSGSSTTAPMPIATASAATVAPTTVVASVVQLPETEAVRPGADFTFVDGKPLQTERTKDATSTKVKISGTDFSVVLGGTSAGGNPLKLSPSGAPILAAHEKLAASGDGYFPGTQIGVYVVEPLTSLGSIGVGADGAFAGSITMPASLLAGDYVIQMNGYTPASQVRSISVGVTVRSAALDLWTVRWPVAGGACGKVSQRPKSGRVSLPSHIRGGRNLLLAKKVRMSSGQMAEVRVLCRPRTRAGHAGDVAYCRTRHEGKRTFVLVRPDIAMTATVSITVPATGKYAEYHYLKTYRIK